MYKNANKCLDFASVIVSMRYTGNNCTGPVTYSHCILQPEACFLRAFKTPRSMAANLEAAANKLTQQWDDLNGDAKSAGRRTAVEKAYTLWHHSWRNERHQQHFGEVEMQVGEKKRRWKLQQQQQQHREKQ